MKSLVAFYPLSLDALRSLCAELFVTLSVSKVLTLDRAQEKFWDLTRPGGHTDYGIGHQYLMRLGNMSDEKFLENFPLHSTPQPPELDLQPGGFSSFTKDGKWISRVPLTYKVEAEYLNSVLRGRGFLSFSELPLEEAVLVRDDLIKEITQIEKDHDPFLSPLGWATQFRQEEQVWTNFIRSYSTWRRYNACFVKARDVAVATSPNSPSEAEDSRNVATVQVKVEHPINYAPICWICSGDAPKPGDGCGSCRNPLQKGNNPKILSCGYDPTSTDIDTRMAWKPSHVQIGPSKTRTIVTNLRIGALAI